MFLSHHWKRYIKKKVLFCFVFKKHAKENTFSLFLKCLSLLKENALKTKTKARDIFLSLCILLELSREMVAQLRPIKENYTKLCLQHVSFKSVSFPKCSHTSKIKRLVKFSTDEFANNNQLNNRALAQCCKAGSAFQLEGYFFAGIVWYFLQETNDLQRLTDLSFALQ